MKLIEIKRSEPIANILNQTPMMQCSICKKRFYLFCLIPDSKGLVQYTMDADIACPECLEKMTDH